ncbi:MAG: TetR/AcrR family transcriptional regulator [Pseudomonadaceae bacterium]|nr:TetR/AcrR family transcriptional regulator [Pseudomonadaceae bacterium]
MGNREKIIRGAIELMNARGSAVGTSALAEHLGISPGNLYYHFRNREAIVAEILTRCADDLHAILDVSDQSEISPERFASCYVGGVRVLFEYRFLFSSALELVSSDASLTAAYRKFSETSVGQLKLALSLARAVAASERALTDDDARRFCQNMWLIWTGWPRYAQVNLGRDMDQTDQMECLRHLTLLIEPYVTPAFFQAVSEQAVQQFAQPPKTLA